MQERERDEVRRLLRSEMRRHVEAAVPLGQAVADEPEQTLALILEELRLHSELLRTLVEKAR